MSWPNLAPNGMAAEIFRRLEALEEKIAKLQEQEREVIRKVENVRTITTTGAGSFAYGSTSEPTAEYTRSMTFEEFKSMFGREPEPKHCDKRFNATLQCQEMFINDKWVTINQFTPHPSTVRGNVEEKPHNGKRRWNPTLNCEEVYIDGKWIS